MLLQTNLLTIYNKRSVFLYALLLLFPACNTISNNSEQKTKAETPAAQTASVNQTNKKNSVDDTITYTVSVIPEQDPDGIYYGLRDTVSGKLILGYTYQKIYNFREGFALV